MEPLTIRELYVTTIALGALAGLARELRSSKPLTIRSMLGSVLWGALNSLVSGMLYKEFVDESAITTVPIIGLLGAMGGAAGFEKFRHILAKSGVAEAFLDKSSNDKPT
jgi:hypothetical protein